MKHLSDHKETIKEILLNSEMQRCKKFIQHGNVSVFSHSVAVAIFSYRFAKKMRIKADLKSLIRGALLHDFFLYDWHDDWNKLHGFTHPTTALKNASRIFNLNEKEKNIIHRHMWPMTLRSLPTCREAWIVCLIDKYCSLLETFGIFRYNYNDYSHEQL